MIFFSGVAGGTASGKTTVCNMINSQLHDQRIVLINQVIILFCFNNLMVNDLSLNYIFGITLWRRLIHIANSTYRVGSFLFIYF